MASTHASIPFYLYAGKPGSHDGKNNAAREWKPCVGNVISEATVSLSVNGESWLSFSCTPTDLEALGVGFLYNEGIIQAIEEIAALRLCAEETLIDVWLNHNVKKPEQWQRASGCTGGVTATAGVDNGLILKIDHGSGLAAAQINILIRQLFESQGLYREVGGVHTSALSDGRSLFLTVEDIGRHNTLDKIAGLCLLKNLSQPRRVLLTTGRISGEMVQKTARLGAPILVSPRAVTSQAVELAEVYGITLVGYARREEYNIYTHSARILTISSSDTT